jgi:hypothetical protein
VNAGQHPPQILHAGDNVIHAAENVQVEALRPSQWSSRRRRWRPYLRLWSPPVTIPTAATVARGAFWTIWLISARASCLAGRADLAGLESPGGSATPARHPGRVPFFAPFQRAFHHSARYAYLLTVAAISKHTTGMGA